MSNEIYEKLSGVNTGKLEVISPPPSYMKSTAKNKQMIKSKKKRCYDFNVIQTILDFEIKICYFFAYKSIKLLFYVFFPSHKLQFGL